MKSLFHLVSGQNLPPYIASEFIKPDENVFFYTEGSRANFSDLKKVIGGKFSAVKVDAFDFNLLMQSFETEISKRPSDELYLNFTGGTKIMSIAAFEVFRKYKRQAFYINTDNNSILNFLPDRIEVLPMDIKIQPSVYLNLQGQKVRPNASVSDPDYERLLVDTAEAIIKNKKEIYPFLMKFAEKYQSIGKSLIYEPGPASKIKGSYIRFSDGMAEFCITVNGNELFKTSTPNKDFLHFLRGKWFETATFIKIKELGIFDTVEANLEIDWKGNYSKLNMGKNEIDVFAIKGVIPYVFECKSGAIKNEFVNKLKAIKETFLGRFSNVYFISVYPPSNEMYERFKEQGITYLNYYEINKLRKLIDNSGSSHLK